MNSIPEGELLDVWYVWSRIALHTPYEFMAILLAGHHNGFLLHRFLKDLSTVPLFCRAGIGNFSFRHAQLGESRRLGNFPWAWLARTDGGR